MGLTYISEFGDIEGRVVANQTKTIAHSLETVHTSPRLPRELSETGMG